MLLCGTIDRHFPADHPRLSVGIGEWSGRLSVKFVMGRLTTFVVTVAALAAVVAQQPVLQHYEVASRESTLYRVAVVGDSYTNGTAIGGQGPKAWTVQAWQTLAGRGVHVAPDVAAEGRAGYSVRGDQGSIFLDLTGRAVRPDDALVVFFGSRNDQGVDPSALAGMSHDAFALARRIAPSARLLVIGPPWPTTAPPPAVLQIRDILKSQAQAAGASFFDPISAGWFAGRPDLIGADGVHPTDAGHAYLAQRITPLINAQLPRGV
ncbi:SGNH/GDSL hydrolase family protein [soil metagenome]